jgi:hypothetical protein
MATPARAARIEAEKRHCDDLEVLQREDDSRCGEENDKAEVDSAHGRLLHRAIAPQVNSENGVNASGQINPPGTQTAGATQTSDEFPNDAVKHDRVDLDQWRHAAP